MAERSFRGLIVWRRAMELAESVYAATAEFPKAEQFGLTSQLRRAAISIASNIAEGHDRATSGEFRQFLGMARGSAAELQTQLILAKRLEFGSSERLATCDAQAHEVHRMLSKLMIRLASKQ